MGAEIIMALAVLGPAGLAVAALVPGWTRTVASLAIVAPLPVLGAAFVPPHDEAPANIVHLGLTLGTDAVAPVFLLAAGLTWGAAAWQARLDHALIDGKGGTLFTASLMAGLCGAAGAALALEPTGFYLFFSIMTLAAYGLIVSAGPQALWAGRLFIGLALVGEMAMLAGFMLAAGPAVPGLAVALLFYFGMGTKHAVLPMHPWLPPAHGAAPPAASALLSGPILATGVVAWLRFLPLAGDEGLAALAPLMAGGGLAAAFLAAAAGVVQSKPKVVLAYSSVSQMGILTAAGANAVAHPAEGWAAMVPAMALFSVHHSLTKGALFLGVQSERGGRLGGLVFPVLVLLGLSIGGFSLSGGALAKLWLHEAAPAHGPDPWLGAVATLLPWAAAGSSLLMARALWLIRPGAPPALSHRTPPAPMLALAVVALGGGWAVAAALGAPLAKAVEPATLWKGAWPVLLALAVAALAVVLPVRLPRGVVPNGDIAVWLARLVGVVRRGARGRARSQLAARSARRLAEAARLSWVRSLDTAGRLDPRMASLAATGAGGFAVALGLGFLLFERI